ncbi:Uncharacterized protein PBTT_09328 [Plasmodiophora brassicae]
MQLYVIMLTACGAAFALAAPSPPFQLSTECLSDLRQLNNDFVELNRDRKFKKLIGFEMPMSFHDIARRPGWVARCDPSQKYRNFIKEQYHFHIFRSTEAVEFVALLAANATSPHQQRPNSARAPAPLGVTIGVLLAALSL